MSITPEAVNDGESFREMGLHSVLGVQLVQAVNRQLGTNLDVTVTYAHPTINDLVPLIAQTLQQKSPRATAPSAASEPQAAIAVAPAPPAVLEPQQKQKDEPIAIVGISCRFPRSENLAAFWKNLSEGVSVIGEIPKNRWSVDAFYDENLTKPWKMNSRWGGFLEDYDKFDPEFFKISPKEAVEMDPQQRLVLEEIWHAIEDAGYAPDKLPTKQVGIFTASAHGDYVRNADRAAVAPTGHLFIGNNLAILAARAAYLLDFKGPALNVDTACSSSLVATHLACTSLRNGESKVAIVAACNIFSTEYNFLYYTKSGMLSPAGRCKVFDSGADGFVPGEGAAALVLKPLSEALRDGDHVYGVIRDTGINQDGKTNGMTAPSQKSQSELQVASLQRAEINPETIGYVEAHGTGTKLGDPIEVSGLTGSFRVFTDKTQFCHIGSVKSNIGHTISVAGIAGLIKAVMSLKTKTIVPTLHVETPNALIGFDQTPFKLALKKEAFPAPRTGNRRALVNSFGMSGTNAIVLLEEHPESSGEKSTEPVMIPISGRDKRALERAVEQFKKALAEQGHTWNLRDVAFTYQTGRKHFAEKLAVICSNVHQLKETLDAWSIRAPDRLVVARGVDSRYIMELKDLAAVWLSGKDADWTSFYGRQLNLPAPKRVSLPGYPFASERYWIDVPPGKLLERQRAHDAEHAIILRGVDVSDTIGKIIAGVLGMEATAVDANVSLAEYGFDSIMGLVLKERLETKFAIKIPVKDFFENLTLSRMRDYVQKTLSLSAAERSDESAWTLGVSSNVTPSFLTSEAEMPLSISGLDRLRNGSIAYVPQGPPATYFLTGMSGYVGAHLLEQLMKHSTANAVCLVRGQSAEASQERIRNNLQAYGLWKESYAARITVALGDLSEKNFGLPREEYLDLARRADCIIHAGAVVNHILSYHDLRKVNIGGTIEVVRFATEEKVKPVHYISTIGTVIRRIIETGETKVTPEEDSSPHPIGLEVGYGQSKWVAEQILWRAKQLGLPVSTARVGELTGSTDGKHCRTDDMFHMLVKTFSELNVCPDEWPEGTIDIIPIDYFAESFIKIVLHDPGASRFHHFIHPKPVSAMRFFDWLRRKKPMETVPFDQWLKACIEHVNANPANNRNRILKQILKDTPFGYRFGWYFKRYPLSIEKTQTLLQKDIGLTCPDLDTALFDRVFSYIFVEDEVEIIARAG